MGGPGLRPESEAGRDIDEGSLPVDRGPWTTAGPDVGDAELDGDSDAEGTGERAAAGRDTVRPNGDIAPDRVESESGALLGPWKRPRTSPRKSPDGTEIPSGCSYCLSLVLAICNSLWN
jgi:hypothetical protein